MLLTNRDSARTGPKDFVPQTLFPWGCIIGQGKTPIPSVKIVGDTANCNHRKSCALLKPK